MPFKTNDPKINRKGRPAGKPNKTTDELRAMVVAFIDNNIGTLQESFDFMQAKEQADFILKALRLVLPPPVDELQKLDDESLSRLINKISNIKN